MVRMTANHPANALLPSNVSYTRALHPGPIPVTLPPAPIATGGVGPLFISPSIISLKLVLIRDKLQGGLAPVMIERFRKVKNTTLNVKMSLDIQGGQGDPATTAAAFILGLLDHQKVQDPPSRQEGP